MQKRFELHKFTASTNWWSPLMWGGGHTLETDPTRHGWQAKALTPGSQCVVVGRRGIVGCFSAMQMGRGLVDIAVYLETPEDVARALQDRVTLDAAYHQVPDVPGWALHGIEFVKAEGC